jgi:hypothetical protein
MAETGLGLAARTDVAQFRFEALHLEPHRGAAEESQRHQARRRVGLLEADRQQVQRFARIAAGEADLLDFQHPVETQHRADPLMAPLRRGAPIVAQRGECEALLRGQPDHFFALDARILGVRRDNREVLGVEGDQLERGGGLIHDSS